MIERRIVGILQDKIEIDEAGNFLIPRTIYPAVERLFGPQNPIAETSTYVVLEQIKTSRPFKIGVSSGVVVTSYNVIINEDRWVVDAPDLYEAEAVEITEESSEDEIEKAYRAVEAQLRLEFFAMLRGDFPVTADRKTHISNVFPKTGVETKCCVVFPRMTVDGILGGYINGKPPVFYIDGYATLYIKPVV